MTKSVGMMVVVTGLVLGTWTNAVFATAPIKKGFEDHYPALKSVVEEQKCNLCHFGKSKKNRNDYGRALAQLLKKENFKEDRVKAEPEKVKAEFAEAFKKVEAEKSKSGETFGERLKAGKAPGTPEEEK